MHTCTHADGTRHETRDLSPERAPDLIGGVLLAPDCDDCDRASSHVLTLLIDTDETVLAETYRCRDCWLDWVHEHEDRIP